MKFKFFLLDFTVPPLIFALIVLIIGEASLEVSGYHKRGTYVETISLYESFTPSSDDSTEDEETFRNTVSLLENLIEPGGLNQLPRLYFLQQALSSENLSNLSSLLRDYNFQALSILLNDKGAIPDLIASEEEKLIVLSQEVRERRPDRTIWYPLYAFMGVSVFIIYYQWLAWGMSLAYLPFKAWWFYLYMLLASPAVLSAGALMLITRPTVLTFNSRRRRSLLSRRAERDKRREESQEQLQVESEKAPPSYEDLCADIQARFERSKKAWFELFSKRRLSERKDELSGSISNLKDSLRQRGSELEEIEREYFRSKKELAYVSSLDPDIQERIEKEFEGLLKNPLIKAVEVSGTEIHIYTDNLIVANHISSGYGDDNKVVGPFKIVVGTAHDQLGAVKVFAAHKSTIRHWQGAGSKNGNHCFGDGESFIRSLLKEFKICEAIGIVLDALQSH